MLARSRGMIAKTKPPPNISCEVYCNVLNQPALNANKDEAQVLRWGRHNGRFGPMLAAAGERGLVWLGFIMDDDSAALAQLAKSWPQSQLREDHAATKDAVDLALASAPMSLVCPLPLLLRGTPFQIAVWQALLLIPKGALVSYQEVAAAVGKPTAVRATGSAVGANPIAILIPCHRVILKSGALHAYGWGSERKRAIISSELASELNISG